MVCLPLHSVAGNIVGALNRWVHHTPGIHLAPSFPTYIHVGRGGSLVDSSPFVRRIAGSNQWSNYRKISKGAQIQRRKSVGLHNFGGADIVKIGGDRYCKNWGNCKRRRREAAIAEGKKPVTTRGSAGAS